MNMFAIEILFECAWDGHGDTSCGGRPPDGGRIWMDWKDEGLIDDDVTVAGRCFMIKTPLWPWRRIVV